MGKKLDRRKFLQKGVLGVLGTGVGLAVGLPKKIIGAPAIQSSGQELTINRISLHRANGRRKTPVAPNAYAEYRGYGVFENVLQIQTDQGITGATELYANPKKRKPMLQELVGMNPFDLFRWEDDKIVGANPRYKNLVDRLYGADMALVDIFGKVLGKPAVDVLGNRVRETVTTYDSSLYMEDLLTEEQATDLAYLDGGIPKNPAEMVARKAEWIMEQPHGIRIFKVKIGRAKWMDSFEESLQRDIEVMQILRETVGDDVTLFVDGNNGYDENPMAVKTFLSETADLDIYAMEEMFSHEKVEEYREIKEYILENDLPTKLADGEIRGIPEKTLKETVGGKPLFEFNQPDMNWYGFHKIGNIAAMSKAYGVNVATHNFGSVIGVATQTHIGMVTPNWEFSESDDTEIPAVNITGVEVKNGQAIPTGVPGVGIEVNPEHFAREFYTLES